jgi:hypothetical protein
MITGLVSDTLPRQRTSALSILFREDGTRCVMSEPVRARRLRPDEGQYVLRLVRRGNHESIRVRRALIIMASASGTTVPAIARLVAADADTVRGAAMGCAARTQRRCAHAGGVQIDPRGPTGRRPDLRHLRQPGLQQNSGDPGVGSPAQGRAVSDTDQRLGPTRSRHSSVRCGSSRWPTPTTPTTPRSRGSCTRICGGATPATGIRMCWPRSVGNVSGSAANATADGADLNPEPRDQPDDQ